MQYSVILIGPEYVVMSMKNGHGTIQQLNLKVGAMLPIRAAYLSVDNFESALLKINDFDIYISVEKCKIFAKILLLHICKQQNWKMIR